MEKATCKTIELVLVVLSLISVYGADTAVGRKTLIDLEIRRVSLWTHIGIPHTDKTQTQKWGEHIALFHMCGRYPYVEALFPHLWTLSCISTPLAGVTQKKCTSTVHGPWFNFSYYWNDELHFDNGTSKIRRAISGLIFFLSDNYGLELWVQCPPRIGLTTFNLYLAKA